MTHTPTDALRLVPCPFCGGDVINTRSQEMTKGPAYYWHKCETCGAETEGDYGEDVAVAAWNRRAAPAWPLPGGGNILWMMHVRGPDDIYPAPDYETAVAWCDYVNDVLAKRLPDVMMKAVPAVYPRTREEHAAGLPDAIKGWTLPAAPTGEPK